MRRVWRLIVVVVCITCVRCTSPEASRTRGGGPGADIGNRPATVEMHAGSDQFFKTPERLGDTQLSLEPARHAQELRQ